MKGAYKSMKKEVRQFLADWMEENEGKVIPFSSFIFANGDSLSWAEMTKYVRLEKATGREYWTIQEIVHELNSCSGADCYDCEFNFKIDEDGRVYNEISGYVIKGWRK